MYTLIAIGLVSGLLAVNWVAARTQLKDTARSPVTWLAAAMLIAFFASALIGINPTNSLAKWIELAGAGIGCLLLTVILRQMPLESVDLVGSALAISTIAMSMLALVDILLASEAFSTAYQLRIRGFASRLNFFSSALAVLLPITIAELSKRYEGSRTFIVPAIVGVVVIAAIACGGRSGWAGTAAALSLYFIGLLLLRTLKLRLWHVAFAALVIAAGFGLYANSYGVTFLQQRLLAQESIGPLNGRLAIWKVGIDHLGDNPLLGIGLTNYKDLPDASFRHPHNWAVQLALETGAIGIALFCAFISAILLNVVRTARNNRFGLATIASIGGFLVAGLANTSVVNMWWLTFLLLGSVIGYQLSNRTSNPYSAADRPQDR